MYLTKPPGSRLSRRSLNHGRKSTASLQHLYCESASCSDALPLMNTPTPHLRVKFMNWNFLMSPPESIWSEDVLNFTTDEERNARWFGSAAVETITLLETRNTFRLILVLHSLHPGCRVSFCHRAPSGRRTPVKKTAADTSGRCNRTSLLTVRDENQVAPSWCPGLEAGQTVTPCCRGRGLRAGPCVPADAV